MLSKTRSGQNFFWIFPLGIGRPVKRKVWDIDRPCRSRHGSQQGFKAATDTVICDRDGFSINFMGQSTGK